MVLFRVTVFGMKFSLVQVLDVAVG